MQACSASPPERQISRQKLPAKNFTGTDAIAGLLWRTKKKEQKIAKIFIAHRVKDDGAWKINYNADTDRRASAGFSEGGHYHSATDPNTFMIIWNSELDAGEAQARVSAMFSDPDLLALMSKSVVIV